MIKLNTKGFSHHLLIALLVISGIAGFGAWRVFSSSAAVTAGSLCGSSYSPRKSVNITKSGSTEVIGRLNLLSSGNNYCAVLMSKNSAYGVSKPMSVELSRITGCVTESKSGLGGGGGAVGSGPVTEQGNFKYYAGPVKRNIASGGCALTQGFLTYGGKTYVATITLKI